MPWTTYRITTSPTPTSTIPISNVFKVNSCFKIWGDMHRLKRKVGIISVAGLLLCGWLANRSQPAETLQSSSAAVIPHKIWQTWRRPVDSLGDDELQRFIQSWTALNPDYRYELITDQAAVQFVDDRFQNRPDIVDTFHRINDRILRADYLRYLLISSEGGIYSDIDTECTRPVYTWIPPKYQDSVRCVIGIEYDARSSLFTEPFPDDISFCQWTFLAMPRHPVMQHVVDLVTKKLQQHGEGSAEIVAKLSTDVGDLTGPGIFTRAVFDALPVITGEAITVANVTGLQEPKLFGDVLILPVSAFGSGQAHSGSKDWGNDEQLISHHFRMTWRTDHGGGWG